jgi:hypothetical protein
MPPTAILGLGLNRKILLKGGSSDSKNKPIHQVTPLSRLQLPVADRLTKYDNSATAWRPARFIRLSHYNMHKSTKLQDNNPVGILSGPVQSRQSAVGVRS